MSRTTAADILEMVNRWPANRRGECDRCHAPAPRPLWDDNDEPGEWSYCGPCWRQVAALRAHREALRPSRDFWTVRP